MATRMQQRRGTAAQWISTNSGNGPILAAGEIGFESDTNKFKIGDGVNHWVDLTYFTDAASAIDALTGLVDGAPELLNTLNELAAALGDDPTFFTTVATNLSDHEADTTNVHGILDTNELATKEYVTTEIGNSTVDQSALAGTGIDWNLGTEQFDIDSTVATKTYADGAANDAQAAAETTASNALSSHASDTTGIHGIADTADLATKAYADEAVYHHSLDTTSVHGIADTTALATKTYADNAVSTHNSDTTSVHGIADTNALATKTYADGKATDAETAAKSYADGLASNYDAAGAATSAVSAHESDTTNIHGIADTSALATKTYADNAASSAQTAAAGYTDTAIGNLVDGAPNLLNTLNELAAAINDDASIADTLTTAIGDKVAKSGDTMTGDLTLPGAPTADLHAATKLYVDTEATAADNSARGYADTVSGNAYTNAVQDAQTFATNAYNNATSYADGILTQANGYTNSAIGTEVGDRNLAISEALVTAAGDATTKAGQALTDANLYTDQAESDANDYTDTAIGNLTGNVTVVVAGHLDVLTGTGISTDTGALEVDFQTLNATYDALGAADTAYTNATLYTDDAITDLNLANTYDAKGAAATVAGNLTTHESDTSVHGVAGNVVGTSDQQTLTNKTISYTDNTLTVQVANVSDLTATATELNTLDGITASTQELNYVDGVTSSVQDQLDDKAPLAAPTFTGLTSVDDLEIGGSLTFSGTATEISSTNTTIADPLIYLADGNPGNINDLGFVANYNDGTYAHTGLVKDSSAGKWKLFTGVTDEPTSTVNFAQGTLDTLAVATLEGNVTGNVTGDLTGNADTATALETARNIAGQSFDGTADINIAPTDLTGVTANAAELNILDGATLSTTELNYVDGVTSSIQDQIDAKLASSTAASTYAPIANPTFTGTVAGVTKSMVGLGNVDNTADADKPVSTDVQAELDLKADLNAPTFTGSVVLPSTTAIGDVSGTEIGYLDGVTSGIQSQINSKQATLIPGTGLDVSGANISIDNAELSNYLLEGVSGSSYGLIGTSTYLDVKNTNGYNKEIELDIAAVESKLETDGFAKLNAPTFTGTVSGITASMVGLGNVDNTSDANKPVSTATQTALNLKADLSSPALTGTPTAPTQSAGDNSTKIATTAYADAAVAALVDSAPSTLNTLNELAAAINDDASYAATITTALGEKAPLASPTFTGTVDFTGATVNGISSYEAPTLGSTSIASGATVTTVAGLTLSNPTITAGGSSETVTTTSVYANSSRAGQTSGTVVFTLFDMPLFSGNSVWVNTDLLTNAPATVTLNDYGQGASFAGTLSGRFSQGTLTFTATDTSAFYTAYTNIYGGFDVNEDGTSFAFTVQGSPKTISSTEISYLDGLTTGIQSQLDDKAPTSSPTFSGTVSLPYNTSIGSVSNNEVSYLSGVTSAIQNQLNAKAPASSPTFSGTVDFSGATVNGLPVVDGLPSQSGNTGKYLTTDGTIASWATVSGGGTATEIIHSFAMIG